MFSLLLLVILSSLTSGAQYNDGTLQCQCTCNPVGHPGRKMYTTGNMNIVDKTSANIKHGSHEQPKVMGSSVPAQKEITDFQDVTVSKIRHSLGSVSYVPNAEDIGQSRRDIVKPTIKWSHRASSNDALKSKTQQQNQKNSDNPKLDSSAGGLGSSGSLMRRMDSTISETNADKPSIDGHRSTLSGNSKDGVKDAMRHQSLSQQSVLSHGQDSVLSGVSNSNSDKVAADIGFVLDGSAPNPILSGGLSGMSRSALGTGYFVEQIKKEKPEMKFFENKMKETNQNSQNEKVVKEVKLENAKSSIAELKHTNETKTPPLVAMETSTDQNMSKHASNNNKEEEIANNNKQTESNNIPKGNEMKNNQQDSQNKQSWKNKDNSWSKKDTQSNNRWQNKNQQNKGGNIRNNNQNNDRNTGRNNHPNNGRNTRNYNNDRNTRINSLQWIKDQLKPFSVQRDRKQSGTWNNNNNWGQNNWGTTPNPISMPFAMMGMDPIMFLGHHHF